MNVFNGRINRASYWLGLAIIIAFLALVVTFAPRSNAKVSEVVLMFLAIPRLHDIGRTGWWVLVGIGLEIAGIVLALTVVPPQYSGAAMAVVVLLIFALMAWLGAIPGSPGKNRFGEPPRGGLRF